MAILRYDVFVAAGSQFNGEPLNIPNSGGLMLTTLEFEGGAEAGKSITVYRVNEFGTLGAKLYEKLAFAESDVLMVAALPLGPKEKIAVVSLGLTAEAFFHIYYKEPMG